MLFKNGKGFQLLKKGGEAESGRDMTLNDVKIYVQRYPIHMGMALVLIIMVICLFAKCIGGRASKAEVDDQVDSLPAAADVVVKDAEEEEAEKPDVEFTELYLIDDSTGFYRIDEDGNAYFNAPDGMLGGLFTGKRSEKYEGMTEIDCLDGKALVYSNHSLKIDSPTVLPLGVQSQFNEYGSGSSACGAAVLHNLLGGNFDDLIAYSDYNGFSDQGSLYSTNGGMTYDAMAALAKEYYGAELVNVYSESEEPSAIVKKLIDEGKPVIALVKLLGGDITVEDSAASHFIIINGYIENDGMTEFIYADSYHMAYGGGISLDHISADFLNATVNAYHDEPKTLAYVNKPA